LGSSYKNEALVSANLEKSIIACSLHLVYNLVSKVFTIYLPMGAKKSMIMDPNAVLKDILVKICRERGMDFIW
jgi:hypothetical protein